MSRMMIGTLCFVLLLAAFSLPTLAEPCGWSALGLFADLDGTQCNVDLQLYVQTDVYIILKPGYGENVREVSFRVENFPTSGPDGIITVDWNTNLVVGDIASGVTLTFDPPLENNQDNLVLGTIQLFLINDAWIGENHRVDIPEAGWIDVNHQDAWTYGWNFFFNYNEPDNGCPLYTVHQAWVKGRDFDPPTGSHLSGEFPFTFTMESYYCDPFSEATDYSGRIYVEGTQIGEFAGHGTETHSFDLSTAGIPDGDILHVEIEALGEIGGQTHCLIEYVVDTQTGIEISNDFSLSVVKSLYR